jgi:hypothetical protein
MKTISNCLLGVLLCCLCPAVARSQVPQLGEADPDTRSARIQLGLQAGIDFATLNGGLEEPIGLSSRMGATAGACFRYWLNREIALQLEARYIQQGTSYENWPAWFDDRPSMTDGSLDFDFLTFPLLLRVNFGTTNVRPSFVVGPELAIPLSAIDSWEAPTLGRSGETDRKNWIQSVDIGLTLGAGLDVDAGPGAATLDVRYTIGLRGIGSGSSPAELQEAKPRAFLIMAGYLFSY